MRQVQEMAVEFVNALNAAAAAESECGKLRRLLEEEGRLVQRLKQEKEDEAQMAKRKIERMNQRLAEAQKDVDYATTRADVAENEWVKLKRELEEARETVQLLKPESMGTRQIVLRQGEDKELELANALNVASISESECVKLRTMLEEERELVQRLINEKDNEAQLAKRKIEELDQELAHARKEEELSQKDADAAEYECAKLKRMLEDDRKLVQSLRLEKDDEVRLAKRRIEELDQELVHALKEAELSQKDADAAEYERAKLKRMLEEEQKLVQRLRLEKDAEVLLAKAQIEVLDQELAHARKDSELARKDADAAEYERAELKGMLEEEQKLVQRLRLEKDDEVQLAKRRIEELDQELAHARKDADAAENEWTKVKRELKIMEEHAELLKLQCQEIRESTTWQDEEKALELANALNASEIDESECATIFKRMLIDGETSQRFIIGKDDEAELAKRRIEATGQELAYARREARNARNDADIAENEWNKVKRELKEKEEIVKLLESEIDETRQIAESQVEQIINDARTETEHARNDADIAQNELIKVKEDLQEKLELIKELKLECLETSERAKRQVEEKELELADALNAVTAASSSSAVAQDCAICLTNKKDMTFECGHMTCDECGRALDTCPICRKEITRRIKLFP